MHEVCLSTIVFDDIPFSGSHGWCYRRKVIKALEEQEWYKPVASVAGIVRIDLVFETLL